MGGAINQDARNEHGRSDEDLVARTCLAYHKWGPGHGPLIQLDTLFQRHGVVCKTAVPLSQQLPILFKGYMHYWPLITVTSFKVGHMNGPTMPSQPPDV